MPHQKDRRSLTQNRILGLGALATAVALLVFVAGLLGTQQLNAAPPKRSEPLLPKFNGLLLDASGYGGTELLQGRRGLVFVFTSTDDDADRAAKLVADLMEDARAANIALLGVARDRDQERAKLFAKTHGLDFPILYDGGGRISSKLMGSTDRAALIMVDTEGYIVGGFSGLEGDGRVAEFYDDQIRKGFYLPRKASLAPELGVLPGAPGFKVRSVGGEEVTLASLRGKVVVLMFFLPTCPHCHDMIQFLDKLEKKLANPDLAIIAVSVSPSRGQIEKMVEEFDVKLTMYTDPGEKAQKAYAHRHAVPDTLVIDRQGNVVARRSGSQPRLRALFTMEIRQALGVDNPILLSRKGYSGDETCGVCHSNQHSTWTLTSHAYAFETLAEHGSDRDPECLPCHTVGWDQPGGYTLDKPQTHLEGVQCENCHGRGGPHQSPDFAKKGFQASCDGCHTPEHSLRFVFAERLPMVSHSANQQFAKLSVEERQALLDKRDKRSRTLFEEGEFVGSAACESCHQKEHELWSASAHANAFATLRSKGDHDNADCQKCHTTGFGDAGGWPTGGAALKDVGCESCHGPGGEHVKADARRTGNILALTDKCDSCVILQICGSCHDEANDPGFEFELNDKIDLIRHGFREKTAAK